MTIALQLWGISAKPTLTDSPNRYNISGVVPDAQLYAYRIFSCSQATSDDIIAMSIVDAFVSNADASHVNPR